MTVVASQARDTGDQVRSAPRSLGLSGRLILLTMCFIMLGGLIVYVPSAVSFQRAWVADRVMGAQMIALALAAPGGQDSSPELDRTLLAGVAGAQAIGVRGQGTRWLLASSGDQPPAPKRVIDLRSPSWWGALRGLSRNLFLPSISPIGIIAPGVPGVPGVETVEILLDQAPLKHAVLEYTRNFLVVSLIIAAITGALLYFALHILVVRPVRRLAYNVTAFANDPENAGRIIEPSGRRDEIGMAEEAVARMEGVLASELRQKRRLADLGLAVSKINHELRNMLTTAQLLGDRLGEVEDPTVRRIAPRLVRTLGRAIEFCGATLAYGRASEPPPQRRPVRLKPLVEEQLDLTSLADGISIRVATRIGEELVVDADPDQLARVLLNLMRNSVEAMSRARTDNATIEVSGSRQNGEVVIRIADNGPGIPERVRDRLFNPFQASDRVGGTGLGLPVADELVRLHGGDIVLEPAERGTSFRIRIPDRVSPSRS